MLLYRVDCDDCGAPRVGRKEDDGVEPLRSDCPLCGSTNVTSPAVEDP